MNKPTGSQAVALQHLRNNRDVLEYLQDCLEASKNDLIALNEPTAINREQGRAQVYRDLLTHITGVRQSTGKRQ